MITQLWRDQEQGPWANEITYPNLKLDAFIMPEHGFHFKVNTDSADERRGEAIVRVPEEETGLAHWGIPDDEQFEHVVEILIGRVFLPFRILTRRHLVQR